MKNITTKILMAVALTIGAGAGAASAAPASMQAPAALGAAAPGVLPVGSYGGGYYSPGVKVYVAPRYRYVWRKVCHRHRYVKRYWNGHYWKKRVTYGRYHCHRKKVRVHY
ncbi:MAG TPA: hypothetical protein ENK15_02995 [Thermopetrobacter sp.]|nr:hypothetical protein [Thermopetrobacter sp.]